MMSPSSNGLGDVNPNLVYTPSPSSSSNNNNNNNNGMFVPHVFNGGMRAEERSLTGTSNSTSSLGSLVSGITMYIPYIPSLKKQLYAATGTSSSPPKHSIEDEKEGVLWTCFDELELGGETHQCLVVGYVNGFQIWDIQHNDGGVREIISVREGVAIKCVRILPPPLEKDPVNSPLYGKRPLIAVVSAEETRDFPRTVVRLFSLRTCEYIFDIGRFRIPVSNVLCNRRIMLVVLRDQVYAFNALTMQREFNFNCYPSPTPYGVVALGSRWLAFATTISVPSSQSTNNTLSLGDANSDNSAGSGGTLAEVARDVATDVVKEAAQGLYYLGDIATKKVRGYLYPEETGIHATPSSPVPLSDGENAGVVIIYDIITRRVVSHFKAHSRPVSIMSFDPSGTVLVTSSVEGHHFNVYQITPSPPPFQVSSNSSSSHPTPSQIYSQNSNSMYSSSLEPTPHTAHMVHTSHSQSTYTHTTYRQTYKLKRGMTAATIQDISFSKDSKWMCVSSTRGTTHIYAINPLGGPVSVMTHSTTNIFTSGSGNSANSIGYGGETFFRHGLPPPLITMHALNRIKHPIASLQEETGGTNANVPNSSSSSSSNSAGFVNGFPSIVSSAFFSSQHTPEGLERVFVVTQGGMLTLYNLQPHPPSHPTDSSDTNTLNLTVVAISEWDVGRKGRWGEYRAQLDYTYSMNNNNNNNNSNNNNNNNNSNSNSNNNNSNNNNNTFPNSGKATTDLDMQWLSNVEITTHSTHLRPLWAGPQFTFKTFTNTPFVNNTSTMLSSTTTTQNTLSQPQPYLYPSLENEPTILPTIPLQSAYSDENTPTKKLSFKLHNPIPFKEGMDDNHSQSFSMEPLYRTSFNMNNGNDIDLLPFEKGVPTILPVSEDTIKVNILEAIQTPLDIPKVQIFTNNNRLTHTPSTTTTTTIPTTNTSSTSTTNTTIPTTTSLPLNTHIINNHTNITSSNPIPIVSKLSIWDENENDENDTETDLTRKNKGKIKTVGGISKKDIEPPFPLSSSPPSILHTPPQEKKKAAAKTPSNPPSFVFDNDESVNNFSVSGSNHSKARRSRNTKGKLKTGNEDGGDSDKEGDSLGFQTYLGK